MRLVIAATVAVLGLPAAASGAVVTVNTVDDHNDKVCDDVDCTLREAVELGTNTIKLPKGQYKLTLGELLLVNDSITGAGARAAIIDGGNASRVLRAGDGSSSIAGVTVTGGNGASTVNNGSGGGIFVQSGATLSISASTIDTNTGASGGGIGVAGTLLMDTSTVSANTAVGRISTGGGITSIGTTTIDNSTISGNTASADGLSQGGGIASNGALELNGVTISSNTAVMGAGLFETVPAGAAPTRTILNTIVGGNNGAECAGAALDTDTTHNSLGEDTTCAFTDATDLQGVDPQLRALANNGGGTNTHALLAASPAINRGDGCVPAGAPVDQRGVARPQAGLACDIGAFEYRPHAVTVITSVVNNDGGTLAADQVQVHLRVDGVDAKGSPAPGVPAGRTYSLLTGSAYSVDADPVGGYTLSYSAGCSGPLSEGGGATCTATLDDVAAKLTVITSVVNDNGGTRAPSGFTVHVRKSGADVAGSPKPGSSNGSTHSVSAGTYVVGADAVTGYAAAVSGGCATNGSVTLQVGQSKTCTITANDKPPLKSALPPPVAHKSANLINPTGPVTIKLPRSKQFVPLTEDLQVPLGTIVNVKKGRITLTAASDNKGGTASAWFYGGIFKLGQTKGKKPVTELTLVEKLSGCKAKSKATIAKKKKARKRRLWGDGKGHFRTKGRNSAATVLGTKWLVEDRCTSTLTRVARGKVKVRDFGKRKTVIVRAGHKYIARR